MVTITKKDLIEAVSEQNDTNQNLTRDVIQKFLDSIIDELSQGNRLEFRDFGVFQVAKRAPRIAQNPRTLEKVKVPAKSIVKFKPGKKLKEEVIQAK